MKTKKKTTYEKMAEFADRIGNARNKQRDDAIFESFKNSVKTKKKQKVMKGWAVCFALNKKCLMGEFCVFNRRKNAEKHITELQKKIGGFEDDHHIVPVSIIYQPL